MVDIPKIANTQSVYQVNENLDAGNQHHSANQTPFTQSSLLPLLRHSDTSLTNRMWMYVQIALETILWILCFCPAKKKNSHPKPNAELKHTDPTFFPKPERIIEKDSSKPSPPKEAAPKPEKQKQESKSHTVALKGCEKVEATLEEAVNQEKTVLQPLLELFKEYLTPLAQTLPEPELKVLIDCIFYPMKEDTRSGRLLDLKKFVPADKQEDFASSVTECQELFSYVQHNPDPNKGEQSLAKTFCGLENPICFNEYYQAAWFEVNSPTKL